MSRRIRTLVLLLAAALVAPVAYAQEPGPDPAPAADPDPEPEPEPEAHGLFPSDDDIFPEDGDFADLIGEGEDVVMDEVVVVASAEPEEEPDATGGAVQRLDADLLERFNYDNPDAVFQQVPGAYVRQEGGYGLRPNVGLRGVSSERSARISLMEDGVLFGPAPYAAPAAYYFPMMTRMVGVDVYMGAATVPHGPMTVGGAIDLRSRDIPPDPSAGLDVSFGANLYGRLHAWGGASNGWGGLLAEGVFLRSDGFKRIDGFPDHATGFDRGELLLRGEVHGALGSGAFQRLELRFGVAGERSSETYLGLTDEDFDADPWLRYPASRLGRMEWWRTQAQLRHTLEVGDGFVLRSVLYRHDIDRSWNKVNAMGGLQLAGATTPRTSLFDVLTNPSGGNRVFVDILRGREDSEGLATSNDYILIGPNRRTFGVTGLQTNGTGTFETGPLRHRVRIGARLHHDAVDRHHTEDAYAMLGGNLVRASELVPGVSPGSYTTLRTHVEALALSAFAAYSFTLFDVLTLTPGVRTELVWTSYLDEDGGETSSAFRAAVLPGAGIEWRIDPRVAVFGGVMRGFAPVSPGQAENVDPEDSIAYELGARVSHSETRTSAQVTGFVNDYSNYLQQCSFSSGCSDDAIDAQANGGRPIVGGVDVRVGTSPAIGEVRVPLRASYTFTYSELRSAILDSPSPRFRDGQPGDHLPYIPEHQITVQVGIEYTTFGLDVGASFVSEMWEAVGQGAASPIPRTDATFLLDASAYLEIFEGMRLYVRGENLTMTQAIAARRPLGARPNRPFQIQGGVRLQM